MISLSLLNLGLKSDMRYLHQSFDSVCDVIVSMNKLANTFCICSKGYLEWSCVKWLQKVVVWQMASVVCLTRPQKILTRKNQEVIVWQSVYTPCSLSILLMSSDCLPIYFPFSAELACQCEYFAIGFADVSQFYETVWWKSVVWMPSFSMTYRETQRAHRSSLFFLMCSILFYVSKTIDNPIHII